MNSYEYTKVNRLESPHKYIYTPYLGVTFVSSYFSDRLKHSKRFQENYKAMDNQSVDSNLCMEAKNIFNNLLQKEVFELDNKDVSRVISLPNKNTKIEVLSSFNTKDEIDTELLLSSLVYTQINHKKDESVKEWLDHLVQRFEVTKKLHIRYPEGFRKGEGVVDSVRLYWLFSLSLSLYYANTQRIKYLNTLLKVSDLLCSLESNVLADEIPLQGLSMIIQVEMIYIRSISDKIKRASFDYN
jgi:hypothetical protein